MSKFVTCAHALKEWAVTCASLAGGRQIILLRKGGLLDEDGHFCLEHRHFFLLPTWLHQDQALVKAEHRDLLEASQRVPGENSRTVFLRYYAEVGQVWSLNARDQEKLAGVPHIWSTNYLDLRFSGYRPEKPLLCAALRLWRLETPIKCELQEEDLGCRSWISLGRSQTASVAPVMHDEEYRVAVDGLGTALG